MTGVPDLADLAGLYRDVLAHQVGSEVLERRGEESEGDGAVPGGSPQPDLRRRPACGGGHLGIRPGSSPRVPSLPRRKPNGYRACPAAGAPLSAGAWRGLKTTRERSVNPGVFGT